jgi:hypothetical protein
VIATTLDGGCSSYEHRLNSAAMCCQPQRRDTFNTVNDFPNPIMNRLSSPQEPLNMTRGRERRVSLVADGAVAINLCRIRLLSFLAPHPAGGWRKSCRSLQTLMHAN